MNDATKLHNHAMDLAEEAAIERMRGNVDRAKGLYAAAFESERKAAMAFEARYDMEPTRSVLFRSAASLALELGDVKSSEKMIAQGLVGNPPEEIANELRDLLEQVYFQRHLDLRGIVLKPNEFQVSFTGNDIGLGIAKIDTITKRIKDVETLLCRTAERKENRPFRKQGTPSREIKDNYGAYITNSRAASYAVSFRLGHPAQEKLPGMDPAIEIIEEFLDCLDLIDNESELKRRIPDEMYRNNFQSLVKQIKPDGNRIKTVGFTASLRGSERRFLFKSETNPGVHNKIDG